MVNKAKSSGLVYVGIGGWNFEPWRGVFYPDKLPQAKELNYAASKLTAIEINSTYYGSQKPETFRKWARETPDGFLFSVKASRFSTNRRVLAEGADSIKRFLNSGVTELGDRLGPLLWQFAPTKKFDEADFRTFLELLPGKQDGLPLRHVVEVRHDSFKTKDFVALCRKQDVAIVFAADSEFPLIGDVTADFVYARIMGTSAKEKLGYPSATLKTWAERAKDWEKGSSPKASMLVAPAAPKKKRDVFLFVISGAKERNPAAAQAIIAAL